MNNVLSLAYIGDAVYSVYVREYLVNKGICKVDKLQKDSINYVSAKAQAKFVKSFIDGCILTDEELDIFYRARNHKGTRHPKNTDIITYKYSTGFEAIIGYLYMNHNVDRLEELINKILEV
jgi:ribonuclease-3 family protein